jgi:cytidine deaminase
VLGVGASGHGDDDVLTIFVTVEIEHARFKVMTCGEDLVTGR